jgi:hypothetical protein
MTLPSSQGQRCIVGETAADRQRQIQDGARQIKPRIHDDTKQPASIGGDTESTAEAICQIGAIARRQVARQFRRRNADHRE